MNAAPGRTRPARLAWKEISPPSVNSVGYFMLNDPDCLRSERYGIEKMAIERGALGDETQAPADVGDELEEARPVPALPSAAPPGGDQ